MAALSASFEISIAKYRKALRLADKGSDYNPGPLLVARDIPRIVYDAWIDSVPAVWKVAYEERDGAVLLYGDPLSPHARSAAWLGKEIHKQILLILGEAFEETLDYSTDENYTISGYGVKVPDYSIIPQDRRGSPLPCVVVEFGYHNEQNFGVVRDEVQLWADYGSPVVIGMKITDNASPATVTNPRIEVLVRVKGRADQTFHLGQGSPSPCIGSGTHKLQIPSGLLLPGSRRTSAAVSSMPVLQIDLFPLQERIKVWVVSH